MLDSKLSQRDRSTAKSDRHSDPAGGEAPRTGRNFDLFHELLDKA